MATIDRWALHRGVYNGGALGVPGLDYSGQVDMWSFYAGGPSVLVVLLCRWSFCAGGPSMQVVLLCRWS